MTYNEKQLNTALERLYLLQLYKIEIYVNQHGDLYFAELNDRFTAFRQKSAFDAKTIKFYQGDTEIEALLKCLNSDETELLLIKKKAY